MAVLIFVTMVTISGCTETQASVTTDPQQERVREVARGYGERNGWKFDRVNCGRTFHTGGEYIWHCDYYLKDSMPHSAECLVSKNNCFVFDPNQPYKG